MPPNSRINDNYLVEKATMLATADECGLVAQALLEFDSSESFIFGWLAFPESQHFYLDCQTRALLYAKPHIDVLQETLCAREGKSPHCMALRTAMGIPILLMGFAAYCRGEDPGVWESLARRHFDYLMVKAPRSIKTAAISSSEIDKWITADSLFLILPFMAWCGLWFNDFNAVDDAVYTRRTYMKELQFDAGGLLVNYTCSRCHAPEGPPCGCLRRPTSIGNSLALAGMVRLLGTLLRTIQIATEDQENEAKPRAPSAEEIARETEVSDLLSDIRQILSVLTRGDVIDEETGLIHSLLDDPTSPVDVAASALVAATIYNFFMLVSDWRAESHGRILRANVHYDAVMKWVDDDANGRQTGEPNFLVYCCILMMLGARRNPRLSEALEMSRST
ncbi:hypothetical protein C8A00DRAFT_32377 [Chaetomidium leptoderma]|uniref:Uncharacterized protein n=1 Tax=Chaetomidium leptoderma TaxID=669021 RepID=A0AAN6VP92_9PEZI|nr:hypothetical protein C8A00DRAFT_32377 [Chaetomidium leptoderma]